MQANMEMINIPANIIGTIINYDPRYGIHRLNRDQSRDYQRMDRVGLDDRGGQDETRSATRPDGPR